MALTEKQIKEAADLAKRLSDWRDDVPWEYLTDINSVNEVIGNLEWVATNPETDDEADEVPQAKVFGKPKRATPT